MDARTTMIIAKGKFVTTDVTDCIYHKENHKWEIVFKSGRSFFYNQQNVLCLKNPRNLDPQKYQVCRKGKILDNIETILSFSAENEEYWHLVFSTGYEHDYSCRELQVERSIFENSRAKKVFDYLKEAADVISVRVITYSPQNGVILLVMAFLISPMGLPLAAIWLLGKVQSLKFAIQDWVYG